MSDDLDALLRDHLRASGGDWHPDRSVETTRAQLATRIGRRRRSQASVAICAIGALSVFVALARGGAFGAGSARLSATGSGLSATVNLRSPSPDRAASSPLIAGPTTPSVTSETPGRATTGSASPSDTAGGGADAGGGSASGGGAMNPTGRDHPQPSTPEAVAPPVTHGSAPPTAGPVPQSPPLSTIVPPIGPPGPADTTTSLLSPPVSTSLPVTSVPYPNPRTYVVIQVDSGSTFDVAVGDVLEVQLAACSVTAQAALASDEPEVVSKVPPPLVASPGAPEEEFVALTPGTAVLRRDTAASCTVAVPPFVLTVVVH